MDSIEVYVWLIVFIVLTAIEMATFQLVTIWFAVGAVAAFITSLFSTSLEIQLIVFLAVSMLLLILVRPIAGRFLQTKTVKTNVDSLIGDYATVTARIHNQEGFGKAVIRGQEWTAAAEKDKEAKADAAVLQIKSMEAFEKAADGKATKIIVPSNLASIAGTLTALSETVQKDAPES